MKMIPLSNSDECALVDDADYPTLADATWWLTPGGYAARARRRHEEGKRGQVMMHRAILAAQLDQEVDHVNGDRLDNRRENLRLATKAENRRNVRKGTYRPMSSQFKGVVYVTRVKRWRAVIKTAGKQRHLGYFLNERDAALAYNAAARELFGEFARLNEVAA